MLFFLYACFIMVGLCHFYLKNREYLLYRYQKIPAWCLVLVEAKRRFPWDLRSFDRIRKQRAKLVSLPRCSDWNEMQWTLAMCKFLWHSPSERSRWFFPLLRGPRAGTKQVNDDFFFFWEDPGQAQCRSAYFLSFLTLLEAVLAWHLLRPVVFFRETKHRCDHHAGALESSTSPFLPFGATRSCRQHGSIGSRCLSLSDERWL